MNQSLVLFLFVFFLFAQSHALQPKFYKNKLLCSKSDFLLATSLIEQTPTQPPLFSINECDMITDGPICLSNGDRIFLPFASKNGLNGYWNFDEEKALDQSGNRNHLIGVVDAGPAFGGYGSSSFFSNGNYLYVSNDTAFNSFRDFSLTFLVFIKTDMNENKGIRNCPLIQKGNDDLSSKTYQRNPAIYYDRKDKKVSVYIKANNRKEDPQGEVIISNGKLFQNRWYHIAVVKNNNKVYLYLNGLLDSQIILKGYNQQFQISKAPLYIGNVPWLQADCSFPFLIDELRYYSIALDKDYIQAEASPILGGIEPSYIEIGCLECTIKKAATICNEGYRLCTSIELHTGGYQIARSLGLITSSNSLIWTHNSLNEKEKYAFTRGIALCCAILK